MQSALDELASSNLVTNEYGAYRLVATTDRPNLSAVERAIIEALTSEATMTVQDLSDTVQRSPGTLRPILRKLIARGLVVATAPVTSRKRAYRLPGT